MSAVKSMPEDVQREFEADALRWLRRRLIWCAALFGTFLLLTTVSTGYFATTRVPPQAQRAATIAVALSGVTALVFLAPIPFLLRSKLFFSRGRLIWIITGMICVTGFLKLAQIPFLLQVRDSLAAKSMFTWLKPGAEWMLSMACLHFITSLLIPWTPREAIRPLVPVLAVNVMGVLIYDSGPILIRLGAALAMCIIGVPGVIVAWLRHTRFRDRFHLRALSGRFDEFSQDLTAARRIHESILPKPIKNGPVRFDFRYEPMREIGGDYVHVHPAPDGISVVIIDVTGHGIGAALAVNRLHAELAHNFVADPGITPGNLLSALNTTLHTLASHSMYATAICMRVNLPTNTLAWASAGHPPAFLRSTDGSIHRLDSTAIVLGACMPGDFVPDQQEIRFTAGDAILAYTDGSIESRNREGRMLTIDGLESAVRNAGGNNTQICDAVLAAINSYRFGPLQDDTLIVEVYRPV